MEYPRLSKQYVYDVLRWLLTLNMFLFAAAVMSLLGAWYVISAVGSERAIRIYGLCVECAGLIATAIGVYGTQKLFNRPSLFEKFKRKLAKFPRNRPVVFGAADVSLAGAQFAGTGHVSAILSSDATVEERLTALHQGLELVRSDLSKARIEFDHKSQTLAQAISNERQRQQNEIARLDQIIDKALAGGLSLTWLGLAWFVMGVILTTISDFLSRDGGIVLLWG